LVWNNLKSYLSINGNAHLQYDFTVQVCINNVHKTHVYTYTHTHTH